MIALVKFLQFSFSDFLPAALCMSAHHEQSFHLHWWIKYHRNFLCFVFDPTECAWWCVRRISDFLLLSFCVCALPSILSKEAICYWYKFFGVRLHLIVCGKRGFSVNNFFRHSLPNIRRRAMMINLNLWFDAIRLSSSARMKNWLALWFLAAQWKICKLIGTFFILKVKLCDKKQFGAEIYGVTGM